MQKCTQTITVHKNSNLIQCVILHKSTLAGEIMAVVVKYVVERSGVERMTFTTKKEADAYDKMLDIAESLEVMLEKVDVPLSEQQIESLALEMAKSKDGFINVLKGAKDVVSKPAQAKTKKDTDKVTDLKSPSEKAAS